MHIAFAASLEDVLAAPEALRQAGIVTRDFDGQPTNEAVVIGWMPAASVFFHDPDGHLLEYIAMLPDDPRPDVGVVTWRGWNGRRRCDRRDPMRGWALVHASKRPEYFDSVRPF